MYPEFLSPSFILPSKYSFMIFSSPVKVFSVSAVFSVAMILYLRSHCCRILTVLPVRASVYRVCSKSCCDMYEKLVL
jgi:hypothetical protein